jgi:hypothetical protein
MRIQSECNDFCSFFLAVAIKDARRDFIESPDECCVRIGAGVASNVSRRGRRTVKYSVHRCEGEIRFGGLARRKACAPIRKDRDVDE